MNTRELFKFLITAYKEGNFEEKVNSFLEGNLDNKVYAARVIANLCGVSLEYDSKSFAVDLKNAVENYSTNIKVVTRVKDCTINCTIHEGKTECQRSCPFDAIIFDSINNTTYMDNSKCIDCGLCVDVCPNNNYMDKSEALPLLNTLS